MPNIQLAPFFIDDHTLAWIDKIRDRLSRDEFFRLLMHAGLCNTLEEMAKLSRDFATHHTSQISGSFERGRKLLAIGEARGTEIAQEEQDG
jgi:hypothetical protein